MGWVTKNHHRSPRASRVEFLLLQQVPGRPARASAHWNYLETSVEGDPSPTFVFVTTKVVQRSRVGCAFLSQLCLQRDTSCPFTFHWPKRGRQCDRKWERAGMSVNGPSDLCGRQSNRSESWKGSENASLLECSQKEAALLQFASRPHAQGMHSWRWPSSFGAVAIVLQGGGIECDNVYESLC